MLMLSGVLHKVDNLFEEKALNQQDSWFQQVSLLDIMIPRNLMVPGNEQVAEFQNFCFKMLSNVDTREKALNQQDRWIQQVSLLDITIHGRLIVPSNGLTPEL